MTNSTPPLSARATWNVDEATSRPTHPAQQHEARSHAALADTESVTRDSESIRPSAAGAANGEAELRVWPPGLAEVGDREDAEGHRRGSRAKRNGKIGRNFDAHWSLNRGVSSNMGIVNGAGISDTLRFDYNVRPETDE